MLLTHKVNSYCLYNNNNFSFVTQDVKLLCPISGNPQPIIEWSKDGETIDFTWSRYKTNPKKGFLKFLKPLDLKLDNGVFVCKGINGFGTEQVRIHLLVQGKSSWTIWVQDDECMKIILNLGITIEKTFSVFRSAKNIKTFETKSYQKFQRIRILQGSWTTEIYI